MTYENVVVTLPVTAMVPTTGVVPAFTAVKVAPGAATGPAGVKFVWVQVGFGAGGVPGAKVHVTVLPAAMVPATGEQATEAVDATLVTVVATVSGPAPALAVTVTVPRRPAVYRPAVLMVPVPTARVAAVHVIAGHEVTLAFASEQIAVNCCWPPLATTLGVSGLSAREAAGPATKVTGSVPVSPFWMAIPRVAFEVAAVGLVIAPPPV